MALLVPTTCPCSAPPGELRVMHLLKNDPDTKNWIVLHSLDLAKHTTQIMGEADFVIVIPSLGILVLEIKSHKTVRYDEQGWHLGHDPPELRGPFKQASSALHSLRKYLSEIGASYNKIVMWSAVCFTRLDFRIKSPEWHDWQVIDRSKLTSSPISKTIPQILEYGRQTLIKNNVSAAEKPDIYASPTKCNSVLAALRPQFEIAVSPKSRRKEEEQKLLELTKDQYIALDQMAYNPRVVFSGAAGTGKTVLAMESARRLANEYPHAKIGVFCYNKLLGNELSKSLVGNYPQCTVAHIDGWLSSIAGKHVRSDDLKSPDYFDGRLAQIASDSLLEDSLFEPFDFLIIDEAQDLMRSHYLDVIDLILKGGLAGGKWLFFGDFLGQDIYSRGEIGIGEFISQRSPSAARYQLTTNCRNTLPISDYVVSFGALKPPYHRVLRGDSKQDPQLHFWETREDQAEQASQFIQECLNDGYTMKDIVILSPSRDHTLGRDLELHPKWVNRVEPYKVGNNRISYCTIQGFKGLEAPVILVADFNLMPTEQQQSLLYIGLSRALHRLGIFLNSDLKPFVRSLI